MGKIKLKDIKTEYYRNKMKIEVLDKNIIMNKPYAKAYLKGKISGEEAKQRYITTCIHHVMDIIRDYMRVERTIDNEIDEEEALKRKYDRRVFAKYPLIKKGVEGLCYNRYYREPLHTVVGFSVEVGLIALYTDCNMIGLINETSGLGPAIVDPLAAYDEVAPYIINNTFNKELKKIHDETYLMGDKDKDPSFSEILTEMARTINDVKFLFCEAFYIAREYGTDFVTSSAFRAMPIADRDALIFLPAKDGTEIRDLWSENLHNKLSRVELVEDYLKRVYNVDYFALPEPEELPEYKEHKKTWISNPYDRDFDELDAEAFKKYPMTEYERVELERDRLDRSSFVALYNYAHENLGFYKEGVAESAEYIALRPETMQAGFTIPEEYRPYSTYKEIRQKVEDMYITGVAVHIKKETGIDLSEEELEKFIPYASNVNTEKFPAFLMKR